MKIDGAYNKFLNNMTDKNVVETRFKEGEFDKILSKVQEKAKIEESAEEFEAYFTYKLLKEMNASVPKTNIMGEGKGEYYKDMLFDAYSKEMAKQDSLGIKGMLIEQMSKGENET